MLNQNDMDILKSMMESVVDERISKTEDFILEEIGNTQSYIEKRIDIIQKNVDELSKRVEKLEKRIA